jgi:hypothetical protein
MRQELTETRLEELLSMEEDLMDDRMDWFTAVEVDDFLTPRGSMRNPSRAGSVSTAGSADFFVGRKVYMHSRSRGAVLPSVFLAAAQER